MKDNMPKTYIFGIGTGRCGTQSLARFLSMQEGVMVYHELIDPYSLQTYGDHTLPWLPDLDKLKLKLKYLDELDYPIVGDVAFYYLNYIPYLQQMRNIKVIAIERDKEKVVKSFHFLALGVNHWASPLMDQWQEGINSFDYIWHKTWPDLDHIKSKQEALSTYYDLYVLRTRSLQLELGPRMLTISLDEFNTREGQDKILEFIGIPKEKRKYKRVHTHKLMSRRLKHEGGKI